MYLGGRFSKAEIYLPHWHQCARDRSRAHPSPLSLSFKAFPGDAINADSSVKADIGVNADH